MLSIMRKALDSRARGGPLRIKSAFTTTTKGYTIHVYVYTHYTYTILYILYIVILYVLYSIRYILTIYIKYSTLLVWYVLVIKYNIILMYTIGYIYIEAMAEPLAKEAIVGLRGIYIYIYVDTSYAI